MIDKQLITITEACTLLGVDRTTIKNWMAAGKLDYAITFGGTKHVIKDARFDKLLKHAHAYEEKT